MRNERCTECRWHLPHHSADCSQAGLSPRNPWALLQQRVKHIRSEGATGVLFNEDVYIKADADKAHTQTVRYLQQRIEKLESGNHTTAPEPVALSCPFCGSLPTVTTGDVHGNSLEGRGVTVVQCQNAACEVTPRVLGAYTNDVAVARAYRHNTIRRWNQRPLYHAPDPLALVDAYLGNGGFFNPEMMDHERVRDLVVSLRGEILRLRQR